MRRPTKLLVLGIAIVVVLLLALGALPGFLKTGDPYYVTATVDETSTATVNLTDASPRQFEYTLSAVANASAERPGRSDPYWKGPYGFKESFTHSPFDEFGALAQYNVSAVAIDESRAFVAVNDTEYRVAITQTP
jgi:hypothetical protein